MSRLAFLVLDCPSIAGNQRVPVEVEHEFVQPFLNILHENSRFVVVNKPAGLVCHPTKGDAFSSLISRARHHLGHGAQPHLVNRLDRETSGIVMIAKDPETAHDLMKLFAGRAVRKVYLAIVHGVMEPDAGCIDLPLGKDEQSDVAVKDCVRSDGARAVTRFRVLKRFQRDYRPYSLLSVSPETGRKHQIRIHLSASGHPLVGDKLYGGIPGAYLDFVYRRLKASQLAGLLLPYQALHAQRLEFEIGGVTHRFAAPPEPWFAMFLRDHSQRRGGLLNPCGSTNGRSAWQLRGKAGSAVSSGV